MTGCQPSSCLVRPRDLVIEVRRRQVGRALLRTVRHREHVQDVEAGLIQPIRRHLAQDAAIVETRRGIARGAGAGEVRIPDVGIRRAVLIGRGREIAPPLGQRRHPVPVDVVAGGARLELVRVVEEDLVGAAGLADRAADRESPVARLAHRLGIAVEVVRLAVGSPVGIPLDVVDRSAKPVAAALGDGRDLQAARPSVLGLIVRDQHFHFGDRLDVELHQQPVAAVIHRRHPVHHEVRSAASSDAVGA